MRRLFAFLVVIVIAVGVLGYYREWFTVSHTTDDHEAGIGVTVDKDKVKADKDKAKKEIKEKTKVLSDKLNRKDGDKKP
ncbi:MAG TPA: hypothetical protein VG013_29010 [Gemmataceae bacterium]|nr:hypothetical protein [Gemmataceae bacterium]